MMTTDNNGGWRITTRTTVAKGNNKEDSRHVEDDKHKEADGIMVMQEE